MHGLIYVELAVFYQLLTFHKPPENHMYKDHPQAHHSTCNKSHGVINLGCNRCLNKKQHISLAEYNELPL